MTTSTQSLDGLWEKLEWLAIKDEDIGRRRDITTLLSFREDRCNPLYLFWDLYQPEIVDGEGNANPAPPLSEELEGLLLNLLECLYERYRIPYEPDSDDGIGEYLKSLDSYPSQEAYTYERYEEREEVYLEEYDEGFEGITVEDIKGMERDELDELCEDEEFELEMAQTQSISKYRQAVIKALELEEEDDGMEREYIFTWQEGINPMLNPKYNPYEAALPSRLKDMLIFIHVAAIRAFKIKRTDGYSDEMQDCLMEVERTIERFRHNGLVMYQSDTVDMMGIFQSAYAVSGIVLVELGRICRINGEYEKALHYFAVADDYYYSIMSIPIGSGDDSWPFESAFWPHVSIEILPYLEKRVEEYRFGHFLTGLRVSLREIVNIYESLKANRNLINDWTQVARDWRGLGQALRFDELEDRYKEYMMNDEGAGSLEEFTSDFVTLRYMFSDSGDEESSESEREYSSLIWYQFCYGAYVWASEQLSLSEYRKMREEEEQGAAERRLRAYFFDSNWSYLPEQARARLINADILFNSRQGVALESLLNDLRVATEEMCFQVIWNPIDRVKRGSWDILEFRKIKAELGERHPSQFPGISEYIRICRGNGYSEFLRSLEIGNDDIRFLTKTLPRKMSQLRSERNLAEHGIGTSRPRDAVESFYRGFLGIGQAGVLPELARIGRKLRQSRR